MSVYTCISVIYKSTVQDIIYERKSHIHLCHGKITHPISLKIESYKTNHSQIIMKNFIYVVETSLFSKNKWLEQITILNKNLVEFIKNTLRNES